MRLTWQNLTDGKRALIAYGRAWLWLTSNPPRSRVIEFCWHHTPKPDTIGLQITTGTHDSNDGYSLAVNLLWLNYYITITGFGQSRRRERTTGVRLYGDHLVVQWRCDDSSWSSKTGPAAGWQWSCFVLDKLLGSAKYREGEPEPHRIAVRMPEGVYHGTAVMRADSWKRRLWFRKTIRRAHIDMDEGEQVPIPGKGENSWDCGEDAIYGLTCPADTPTRAANAVAESAMRSRRKYGSGERWRPTQGPYAHVA